MNTIAIIPARYASTRFPGKPLTLIHGKPMIQRVYEQAVQCTELSDIWIATDDERIRDAVLMFGGKVAMTSPECPSGTDRCAQVLRDQKLVVDLIINIQGDEPFIQPRQISSLVQLMEKSSAQIGTMCKSINDEAAIFNPNVVKIVKAKDGKALYFSRNPVPYVRGKDQKDWPKEAKFYKHLGMYAYRSEVLPQLGSLPQGMLENAESLEQLRWLEEGYSIYVAETPWESMGIDTPEDLKAAEIWWKNHWK